ncbi:MAG: hypothetical protein U1B77_01400, partial [Dehalococcoidales bacterium]|nr:hypothetical protein [Dehalococcoidales bacterium]
AEQRDYSERFALEIDREVNKIIDEAYQTAKRILAENRTKLVQIADKLIAQETLEGKDLDELLGDVQPKPAPKVTPSPTPVPVEPEVEANPVSKPASRKPRAIPELMPKQTPTPSD